MNDDDHTTADLDNPVALSPEEREHHRVASLSSRSLLDEARQHNTEKDALDSGAGFAVAAELVPSGQLAVALGTLHAGLLTRRWEWVAEGTAAADAVLARLRGEGL
jgi:hypothetical protein